MRTPHTTRTDFLERRFALSAHGTTVRTEVVAGLTTFLTMTYIVFVQPALMASIGMDFGAVLVAMGHNFFFAYAVVVR